MDSIEINLGDCFLLDIPDTTSKHLYIAIAKTTDDKYLFVNITTRRNKSDTSCILTPDNDALNFIKHESIIAYNFAREINGNQLAILITKNSPIPKESCSPNLLRKIQEGGLKSKQLQKKYIKVLKQTLGIN